MTAVGLDSAEVGWLSAQFKTVYAHAAAQGFKLVAHAGLILALKDSVIYIFPKHGDVNLVLI